MKKYPCILCGLKYISGNFLYRLTDVEIRKTGKP